MSIWDILGIPPTKDLDSIRTAYEKRLTQCPPEVYPEAYRQLQEAYQSAVRYAESNLPEKRFDTDDIAGSRESTADTDGAAGTTSAAYIALDKEESLEAGAQEPETAERDRQEKRELAAVREAAASLMDPQMPWKREAWRTFLLAPLFKKMQNHPDFIWYLTELLQKNPWVPAAVLSDIYRAYGFPRLAAYRDFGAYEPLYRYLQPKWKKRQAVKRAVTISMGALFICSLSAFLTTEDSGDEWEQQAAEESGNQHYYATSMMEAIGVLQEFPELHFTELEEGALRFYYDGYSGIEEFAEEFARFFSAYQEERKMPAVEIFFAPEGALYPDKLNAAFPDHADVHSNPYEKNQAEFMEWLRITYAVYIYDYEPWQAGEEIPGEYWELYVSACSGAVVSNAQEMQVYTEVDLMENGKITVGNIYRLLVLAGADVQPMEGGFSVMADGKTYLFGKGVRDSEMEKSFVEGLLPGKRISRP